MICLQMQQRQRQEIIQRLYIRDGDLLNSVFVASENYLRTGRGQEALHVLDLAFPPSRMNDYRCVLDMLYAELTPWGRREALAYYRDAGPRLIETYRMEEIAVWDALIVRFLEHLQSLYEVFIKKGWRTGRRPRAMMQEARATLRVFKPRMPELQKMESAEYPLDHCDTINEKE